MPIFLLPLISELLEKHIYGVVLEHLTERRIFPNHIKFKLYMILGASLSLLSVVTSNANFVCTQKQSTWDCLKKLKQMLDIQRDAAISLIHFVQLHSKVNESRYIALDVRDLFPFVVVPITPFLKEEHVSFFVKLLFTCMQMIPEVFSKLYAQLISLFSRAVQLDT